jgi:pseudouridine-5'-phosphate glycosidase
LHGTRNLETTYYVTDTTQASDFYWDRESGIRVNIGIHNVQLIAEYGDVDHSDHNDNQFILGNPVDSDERSRFMRVVEQFCR